jgi:hypothetical protein
MANVIRSFQRLEESKNLDDVRRQNAVSLIRQWTEFATRFAGDRLQSLMDRHGIPPDCGNWRAQFRMDIHFEKFMANGDYLNGLYRRARNVRMLREQLKSLPVVHSDESKV